MAGTGWPKITHNYFGGPIQKNKTFFFGDYVRIYDELPTGDPELRAMADLKARRELTWAHPE